MSQINDALKRAGEAPEQPPLPGGPPPLPIPGSTPAGGFRTIPPPPPSSGFPVPVIVVSLVLVGIVFVAAFLLARGWSRKTANSLRDSVPRAVAREKSVVNTLPPVTPAPPQNPITKATAVAVNVATLGSNSVASPTNRGPASMVATNVFPTLKVQGIFYRARNPSAMINSKSVFIGDHVAGVTIVNITADSVTVELNGAKKVLTLY